jgi:quinol monooxygenase YgiN
MILVIGYLKFAPGKFAAARPHMATMVEATRKEPGCLLYAFSEDVTDPNVMHIAERWESWDALKLHGTLPHMADWRAVVKEAGTLDRSVIAYEAGDQRVL